MKSVKHAVYHLVLLTSLFFPAEKVRDIAEDYAEYLREQPDQPESPWQFFSAILREERRYHPKTKTLLAVFAAAILIFAGLRIHNFVPLTFLAVGLPIAVWAAMEGSTAARYSPPHPHAARWVLLPFLAVTLLSAGLFLVVDAAVTEPYLISPAMAWIITRGLRVCSAAFLLLFLLSACLLWRNSIWYFCPLVQSLSAWCFFRGIHYILTSMDVSLPSVQHIYCLIPLKLGLVLSLGFALFLRNISGKENGAMDRHMKSGNTFVYQLVLLASMLFPAQKVRDIAADYAEYLRERPEKPDLPRQFCTAIMREESRYRPKAKTLLAILAAAILFFIGIQVDPVPLSFLTAGLPVALWAVIDGNTTARYSPPHPHAALCALLPVLAIALLAAGFFQVVYSVVTEPLRIAPVTRILIRWGPDFCSTAFLLLFLVSARMLWRSSIWYFCPLVQSVSGWIFFRGVNYIFHYMDIDGSPWPFQYFSYFLNPLALGLTVSLIFALILRNITGRENAQWTDK